MAWVGKYSVDFQQHVLPLSYVVSPHTYSVQFIKLFENQFGYLYFPSHTFSVFPGCNNSHSFLVFIGGFDKTAKGLFFPEQHLMNVCVAVTFICRFVYCLLSFNFSISFYKHNPLWHSDLQDECSSLTFFLLLYYFQDASKFYRFFLWNIKGWNLLCR